MEAELKLKLDVFDALGIALNKEMRAILCSNTPVSVVWVNSIGVTLKLYQMCTGIEAGFDKTTYDFINECYANELESYRLLDAVCNDEKFYDIMRNLVKADNYMQFKKYAKMSSNGDLGTFFEDSRVDCAEAYAKIGSDYKPNNECIADAIIMCVLQYLHTGDEDYNPCISHAKAGVAGDIYTVEGFLQNLLFMTKADDSYFEEPLTTILREHGSVQYTSSIFEPTATETGVYMSRYDNLTAGVIYKGGL